MKKRMNRALSVLLVLALFTGGAYALSSGDSLISLSYLTDVFLPRTAEAIKETVAELFDDTYEDAKDDLDDVQKDLLEQANENGGEKYSAVLAPRDWSDGEVLTLPTGSGFLMQEGTAAVSHNGSFVDVTEGTEVASETVLKAGHRYVVGEDTQASITIISGAARAGIQGTYTYRAGKDDPTPFYDVCWTDPYYEAVNYVYNKGLFAGMSTHEFGPSTVMNRAMVMTVFYNLGGASEEEMDEARASDITFSDVPADAWFARFIRWAVIQKVSAGTSATTFTPGQLINREQMVTLLYSFATNYLGMNLKSRADLSAYADADSMSSWAREPMSWAVAEGIITPETGETMLLNAYGMADRATVAAMLQAFGELTD